MFGKAEERSGDRKVSVPGAEARGRSKLRVRSLFGRRGVQLFSEVDSLEEVNFYRCRLSDWMGWKTPESYRNENDDGEEIEPPVHFACKTSNGQYECLSHRSAIFSP